MHINNNTLRLTPESVDKGWRMASKVWLGLETCHSSQMKTAPQQGGLETCHSNPRRPRHSQVAWSWKNKAELQSDKATGLNWLWPGCDRATPRLPVTNHTPDKRPFPPHYLDKQFNAEARRRREKLQVVGRTAVSTTPPTAAGAVGWAMAADSATDTAAPELGRIYSLEPCI